MSERKKHTPGPWFAKVDLFRPPKLFVHAPDSYAVCRVMTAHYHAETARANAHLIAAAPDLLAALKAVTHRTELGTALFHKLTEEHAEAALAAIAKAGTP